MEKIREENTHTHNERTAYVPAQEQSNETATLRLLAVLGLAAVLVLLTWAVFSFSSKTDGIFSGVVNRMQQAGVSLSAVFFPERDTEETVVFTMESTTATADEPYTISWNPLSTQGSYTFSYACRDGLSAVSPDTNGQYRNAPCDVPFNFTGSDKSIRVIFSSTRNRFLDVPLTVRYTPEGTAQTQFFEKLIVVENLNLSNSPSVIGEDEEETEEENNQQSSQTSSEQQPQTTQPSSGSSSGVAVTPGQQQTQTTPIPGTGTTGAGAINPQGRPDLAVTITGVGYITADNQFVVANSINRTQKAGVKFTIENKGDNVTGNWAFSAILPTNPPFIYQSDMQRNLNPGERIEYTLGFDQVKAQEVVEIRVIADPGNRLNESDKTNNIATTNLRTF